MELKLREIRQRLGLKQRDVALRAGCTRAAIGHWECGRQWPPLPMIPRLADALGVPEAMLLLLDTRPRLCALPGRLPCVMSAPRGPVGRPAAAARAGGVAQKRNPDATTHALCRVIIDYSNSYSN